MTAYIVAFAVGVLCVFLGIKNMKGDISSLHSYHRHRVAEEDILPFGKQVGLGTIIIGVSIMILSVLSILSLKLESPIFLNVGYVILVLGLIAGLIITFKAMIKYNKGIF